MSPLPRRIFFTLFRQPFGLNLLSGFDGSQDHVNRRTGRCHSPKGGYVDHSTPAGSRMTVIPLPEVTQRAETISA